MKLFSRVADHLLAGLVPHVEAAASRPGCNFSMFCYCSYGVAYRRHFRCGGLAGGTVTPCQPSGAC